MRQRMTALVSGMLCCFVLANTALAADRCMTNPEFRAERVRALQSGLMFAALKCVHKPQLRLQENYNELMSRYGKDLASHSAIVQKYFSRTYGAGHRRHLHKYVTSMANRYSVLSFSTVNFCEGMAALGRGILAGDDNDVITLARFNRDLLLPILADPCEVDPNDALRVLNQRVPDPVSVHMPDIDARLWLEAQNQAQNQAQY